MLKRREPERVSMRADIKQALVRAVEFGLLFALVSATVTLYPLATRTFSLFFEQNSPLAIRSLLDADSPIPRLLAWDPLVERMVLSISALGPAEVMGLGIVMYGVLVYALLKMLNPTLRMTIGMGWRPAVMANTFMHTAPIIKAFLIAVAAAIPALFVWMTLAALTGESTTALAFRAALLGAAVWVLFSDEGVAGDYESLSYNPPRGRAVTRSLLLRGACAGAVTVLALSVGQIATPSRLFRFYQAVGGIGTPAFLRVAGICCGVAAAKGFGVGAFACALGHTANRAARAVAAIPGTAILLVTAAVCGAAPGWLASRYDYTPGIDRDVTGSFATMVANLRSVANLRAPVGTPYGMLVLARERPLPLMVSTISAIGLDTDSRSISQVRDFLESRGYTTAVAGPALRLLHDAASLRWDSIESLHVDYLALTHAPEPQFMRLFLDKLRSCPTTPETLHYADLMADESRFLFDTRDSRITMGDIYAHLGRRDKATVWYLRAGVPKSRVNELLSARTMYSQGMFTGRLLLNGKALPNARIGIVPAVVVPELLRALRFGMPIRPYWLRWISNTTLTGSDGRFVLEHVVATAYRLVIASPGLTPNLLSPSATVEYKPNDGFVGFGRHTLDCGDIKIR